MKQLCSFYGCLEAESTKERKKKAGNKIRPSRECLQCSTSLAVAHVLVSTASQQGHQIMTPLADQCTGKVRVLMNQKPRPPMHTPVRDISYSSNSMAKVKGWHLNVIKKRFPTVNGLNRIKLFKM